MTGKKDDQDIYEKVDYSLMVTDNIIDKSRGK